LDIGAAKGACLPIPATPHDPTERTSVQASLLCTCCCTHRVHNSDGVVATNNRHLAGEKGDERGHHRQAARA
jgi:hypothetical protein